MSTYDRFAVITREAFASFLDRHADGRTDVSEWEHYVVQHYGDSFLEEIRRCVVRLVVDKMPTYGGVEVGRELLKAWAFLLRSSIDSTRHRGTRIATIDMTPGEAVVLDKILHRYSESKVLTAANPTEQQCLWNVKCLLDKHGDRPDWPDYADAINELAVKES